MSVRACCSTSSAARCCPTSTACRRPLAGRHGNALCRIFPGLCEDRHRRRAARSRTRPLRPRPDRGRAEARARPELPVPRPPDALRPLLPARPRQAVRTAAGLLHARRDGPGCARDRPRSEGDRVLRPAVVVRLHGLDADAVQFGHAAPAAVVVLPHDRLRRPRRHLQVDQGQRAAGKIFRRPRQRLDAGARPRRPHQGHQRREPGHRPVPEGRQRHRDRRQPGRQAQGRGLRLSGDLARRHRGIPRPAQEHRRRPPPHPRHEHRQLGAGSVHAARRCRRRMDAVLAGRDARPARSLRRGVQDGLRGL